MAWGGMENSKRMYILIFYRISNWVLSWRMHMVLQHGVTGLGESAGDTFHTWILLHTLLHRADLLTLCRVPHF